MKSTWRVWSGVCPHLMCYNAFMDMHCWLQAAAEEVEVDTRDWRARTGGDHAEGMANGGAAPAAPAPQAPPQQQVRI